MAHRDYVTFEVSNDVGIITLDRKRAHNALTLQMIRHIDNMLVDWNADPSISAVLIKANGTYFCAGADVNAMQDEAAEYEEDSAFSRYFHREEYILARHIYQSKKPFIALVNGAVRGDGASLMLPADYRIVSDNFSFAFPETGMGYFPDAGASYFLARCPGMLGRYIGLTGAELHAGDALYAGLATHYVPAAHMQALEDDLTAGAFEGDAASAIGGIAARYGEQPDVVPLESYHATIDQCFGKESVEEIMSCLALKRGEWENRTLLEMKKKSPISLKVGLRMIRAGIRLSLEEALQLEYRVSQHFESSHDFQEGLRVFLKREKHAPIWHPDILESVSMADIDAFFAHLPEGELRFPDMKAA